MSDPLADVVVHMPLDSIIYVIVLVAFSVAIFRLRREGLLRRSEASARAAIERAERSLGSPRDAGG